jgi:hypothetical protein
MASEYINNPQFERNIAQYQNAKKMKARCLLVIEDLRDTIKRKSIRKATCTSERKVLKSYQLTYQSADSDYKDAEMKLAVDFLLLAENLTRYFKFHLIEPDDAVQEGVMICFEKIDRFNPMKGKAFNYMTTCCANHFRQLHRTSKNYNELKKKFFSFKQTCEQRTIIKNGKEIPIFA